MLLAGLSERLNDIHGECRSPRYWRIVLGPWLMRFVQVARDRFQRGALAPSGRTAPRDALEFIVRCYGRDHSPTPPRRAVAKLALRIGAKRRSALTCDLGLPPRELLRLGLAGFSAWPLPLKDVPLAVPSTDQARRARLRGLPANTEFEKAVARVLPDEFPWLHLEGRATHEASLTAAKLAAPAVLVSTDGWHFNEAFKTVAGSFAERGTRLVAVQHGGGYGLYARIWQEELERAIADSYWCWGWSGLESDKRLRDVPAPSLSVAPDSGAPGQGLLLVGTDQPRLRWGFQSQALGESFGRYLEDRDIFFSELGGLRGQCSVRLSQDDMGWEQSSRLSSRFPEIKVETAAGPLHQRLRRCALTVIDHPATSLLEALALDRPTLMFWRPDVWDCRPSVAPLLDGLRRAGILFDEPLAAARAAAEAWHHPQVWWSRREVRAAVLAFRAQFAFSSPNWRKRWAQALKAEVAAARGSK
jgi:putative transferase (TIGR04331 family)